jgi:hypothetical protein
MCCPLILATSLALFGFVASFVSLAAMVSQNGGQWARYAGGVAEPGRKSSSTAVG